jgi:hypothetical protein
VSTSMTNDFVVNICNTILVLGIGLSYSYTFALTMDAHAFNAPPSRRIIGYQCTNPHCGKVFSNLFAYDQHRNHATRAGTLCASIMMREELTGVRRADRSTAVLSARPRPGFDGDAHRAARAQGDEHVALPT